MISLIYLDFTEGIKPLEAGEQDTLWRQCCRYSKNPPVSPSWLAEVKGWEW